MRFQLLLGAGGTVAVLAASACGGSGGAPTIDIKAAAGVPKQPPPNAVVMAGQDGGLAVAIAARPRAGRVQTTATVLAPDGTGKNGLAVSFRRGALSRTAKPCGSGCYSAVLPSSGPRALSVIVSGRAVPFRLPDRLPAPSAARLVRRATAAYRRLRSVAFVERLASKPGAVVISHWKEIAPDRFAYTIPGGAAGIVIGARRWDRTSPRAAWVRSVASPLRVPDPIWGSHPTNAYLLGRRTLHGKRLIVVSLLERSIPAWFTIRFDQTTLRPVSLEMTAAAHFMHHDYVAFDRPLRITPPG